MIVRGVRLPQEYRQLSTQGSLLSAITIQQHNVCLLPEEIYITAKSVVVGIFYLNRRSPPSLSVVFPRPFGDVHSIAGVIATLLWTPSRKHQWQTCSSTCANPLTGGFPGGGIGGREAGLMEENGALVMVLLVGLCACYNIMEFWVYSGGSRLRLLPPSC